MALNDTIGDASARSYVSVADFDAYASDFNLTIPSTINSEALKEPYMRRSAFMLDAIGDRDDRWPGVRVNGTQRLAWPRNEAIMRDGTPIANDVIPPQVADAQCEMAAYIMNNPDDAGIVIDMLRIAKKEKLEDFDVEYQSVKDIESLRKVFTAVEDALAAILRDPYDRRVEIKEDVPRGFGAWRVRRR